MVRTQILLAPEQMDFLRRESRRRGVSLSALVRELIDRYRREMEDAWLREAAVQAQDLYATDPDLVAWRALDAEPFHDWSADDDQGHAPAG